MKVLVVGSGGREHALCRSFAHSKSVDHVFCANGNAGIAEIAECVPIAPDDIPSLVRFAGEQAVGLTFVGGEVPLALGIVDEFEARGLTIIGPPKLAAQLESSKAFAKDFMARHGIPTANYTVAHTPGFAIDELESGDLGGPDAPVVVKADGLAAGKGVVVAANRAEAVAAIKGLANLVGSAAAQKIVLEERLVGREISLMLFADGEDFALMPPARDHKRIGDGDTGPNTGGMGAFTDDSLLTPDQLQEITEKIVRPTLHGCIREDIRYRGILFLGLMMTAAGPKLLEYNVRFGDPETQAVLVRLETDLTDICGAMLTGTLSRIPIKWKAGSSACIVLASRGYPSKPQTGDVIHGLNSELSTGVEVFHGGTVRNAAGDLVTAGGRVLGVTAAGEDLGAALAKAYATVGEISFDGMQFRRDIGKTAGSH